MEKNIEIERKFLVDNLERLKEDIKNSGGSVESRILQYYISDEVRLRVRYFEDEDGFYQEEYFINTKLGKSFMRKEYEYKIPKEEGKFFLLDLQKADKNYISKTRYLFEYRNKTYELDVFEVENKGLIILEIELDDKKDNRFFSRMPRGVGREVTNDERYYNCNLAVNPYSDWGVGDCKDCEFYGSLCCRDEDNTCNDFVIGE